MDVPIDSVRFLRRHTRGVIHIADTLAESTHRTPFAIEPRSGKVIAPVVGPVGEAEAATLFVPDEGDDALQVHAIVEWILDPARSAECDRWSAYHGRVIPGRYALLTPMGVRFGGHVHDPEDADLKNPLAADESRLIRGVNADRLALTKAARRVAGGEIPGPICVGIDHLGMDVRGPLGVLRMEFPEPVSNAEEATEAIRRLML